MSDRKGIDLLRYAVRLLDQCNESFNQRFTASQLLSIAEGMQKCEWDIYPGQWSERQLQECVQFGIVPRFKIEERPNRKTNKLVPVYHNESENVFRLAVTWTNTASVDVYADSLSDAIEWAEGDMPTPKNGTYLDDSFNVDNDLTSDMNFLHVLKDEKENG